MRVVKVGGSLLKQEGIGDRLRDWLGRRAEGPSVLVTGGGADVDRLREEWARGDIDNNQAHWSAIDVMDHSARWLAGQVDVPATDEFSRVQSARSTVVFAPGRFLREREPRLAGERLPVGWCVTSDSIAARIASLLDCSLVLLKARQPVSGLNTQALSEQGYVDEHFPKSSLGLRQVLFDTV